VHSGGLTHDKGGREDPAAGQVKQRGRQGRHELAQLAFAGSDLAVEVPAALQLLAGDPGHHPVKAFQLAQQVIGDALAAQTAAGDLQVGVQLMKMPADLGSDPGALKPGHDDNQTAV
jgi:hypothetical protein